MKLGIISDCIHYQTPDGKVGTENHILLRQFQALCSYFSETLICCPFGEFSSTKVISTYTDKSIHFTAVPLVGGDTLKDKINLFFTLPKWLGAFKKIDKFSDIVYQRFPNNLNIPGFFFFWLKRKKVFATYTGTWNTHASEPFSYRFQKWILKKYFKGPVWVYSANTNDTKRIFAGFSPSYNVAEWDEETMQVNERITRINTEGLHVLRMITVGTLIDYKNQEGILKSCAILKQKKIPFVLTIVGDGPMRSDLDKMIGSLNLKKEVTLAGKKNHVELRELYRQNDFVVQAPLSEGFGKVPVEGFFHGLIPVINNISMAFYITGNQQRGFLFDAADPRNLADKLISINDKIALLPQMIVRGREFAKLQTLEAWAKEYYETVSGYYKKA